MSDLKRAAKRRMLARMIAQKLDVVNPEPVTVSRPLTGEELIKARKELRKEWEERQKENKSWPRHWKKQGSSVYRVGERQFKEAEAAGTCANCGNPYLQGENLVWVPAGWIHQFLCPPFAGIPDPSEPKGPPA